MWLECVLEATAGGGCNTLFEYASAFAWMFGGRRQCDDKKTKVKNKFRQPTVAGTLTDVPHAYTAALHVDTAKNIANMENYANGQKVV